MTTSKEDFATRCTVCTGTFTIDQDAQAHRGVHDACRPDNSVPSKQNPDHCPTCGQLCTLETPYGWRFCPNAHQWRVPDATHKETDHVR